MVRWSALALAIAVACAGTAMRCSSCRLRFRSGRPRVRETAELTLEPGSAYVLSGPVWTQWQHHIPAVTKERWSMTFRTLRRAAAGIR